METADATPDALQTYDGIAWLREHDRQVAGRAWDEGWNAAVDSDGFPGDRNPYRP